MTSEKESKERANEVIDEILKSQEPIDALLDAVQDESLKFKNLILAYLMSEPNSNEKLKLLVHPRIGEFAYSLSEEGESLFGDSKEYSALINMHLYVSEKDPRLFLESVPALLAQHQFLLKNSEEYSMQDFQKAFFFIATTVQGKGDVLKNDEFISKVKNYYDDFKDEVVPLIVQSSETNVSESYRIVEKVLMKVKGLQNLEDVASDLALNDLNPLADVSSETVKKPAKRKMRI